MAFSFFHVFFAEKDLSEQVYEVTVDGTDHFVPTAVVIEAIHGMHAGEERDTVERILRQIDFANGDVHHFLQFLARGLAAQHGGL